MVQLSNGLFKSLGVRPRDPLDALSRELQSHADGIQRLQKVVVKVLAEPLSFFKRLADGRLTAPQRFFRPFLLRDVCADGHETLFAVEDDHFRRGQETPDVSSL